MKASQQSRFRTLLSAIKQLFRKKEPEQPQDPYAYVMAPKKPRNPSRSGAAVAERPED